MRRALLALALAAAGSGCAGAMRFGQPALPYEGRVMLLDAEEEWLTAQARVGEAEREAAQADGAVAAAQARVAALRTREEVEDRNLARGEARAQLSAAKAQRTLAAKASKLARAQSACAQLRYDAERARVARAVNARGADAAAPEVLAEKAGACDDGLEAPRAEVRRAQEELQAARHFWNKSRAMLAKVSPLGNVRPYLE